MSSGACVLCDRIREFVPIEIDGTEYDVCQDCRDRLSEKLKGKGRPIRRDVVLSQPEMPRHQTEGKPFPGSPPKIWLSSGREGLNGI